jgi:hypothetical protein
VSLCFSTSGFAFAAYNVLVEAETVRLRSNPSSSSPSARPAWRRSAARCWAELAGLFLSDGGERDRSRGCLGVQTPLAGVVAEPEPEARLPLRPASFVGWGHHTAWGRELADCFEPPLPELAATAAAAPTAARAYGTRTGAKGPPEVRGVDTRQLALPGPLGSARQENLSVEVSMDLRGTLTIPPSGEKIAHSGTNPGRLPKSGSEGTGIEVNVDPQELSAKTLDTTLSPPPRTQGRLDTHVKAHGSGEGEQVE